MTIVIVSSILAMDWQAIVGANILKLRRRRGLSQEELAVEFASAGFDVIHQELREEDDQPNAGRMLVSVLERPGR